MEGNMKLDFKKLKALVHYVCNKATDPSVLGKVKLNKVLWYADMTSYLVRGVSITGEGYVKRQFGPVPKHFLMVLDELIREQSVARGKTDHFGYMKEEYISITDPDISCFSQDEIRLIDDAFQHVCIKHTATSISKETHGDIWEIAEIGEDIPYFAILASHLGELDEKDVSWARGVVEHAPT
jgi:hypothetical protein